MRRADWREPTQSLPLRWGTYRGRYLGGLLLIVGGAMGLQAATPYLLGFLLAGTVAHVAGWVILPAAGSRRGWAVAPSLIAAWLMLTGPQALWMLTLPFLGWLLVRQRPLVSYLTAIPVLVTGVIVAQVFELYAEMVPAIAVMSVAIVGSAWLARLIATSGRAPANP